MSPINQPALQVFNSLISLLGSKEYIRLQADGFTPLCFECIGHVHCYYGRVKMYSLLQSFTQNGEMMFNPEICFFYITGSGKNQQSGVYPYSYRSDLLGINQRSIRITGNGDLLIRAGLQEQQANIASNWLLNIRKQGFITMWVK